MDPLKLIDELNEQQKKAVGAPPGYVLVLAGPGSGKTRVLTLRIAYLIYSLNIPAYKICAVTFTNKAAREMKKRLEQLFGNAVDGIWLGTFHSICSRVLRREAENLPFGGDFVIYDADDQKALVRSIMKELNINDKLFRLNSIHGAISAAKNNLTLPQDYIPGNYREEVVLRVYERYQEMLLSSNALDFDDLLLWTVKLFQDHPQVRERYAARFEHVMVDEFQDTNQAQYQLLSYLSSKNKNLFVVGDEDQSIYRWRGADYRNVLRFEEDYPGNVKVLLEQNYRSSQTILDAARAVIDQNINRTPKELFTDSGAGEKIVLFEAEDDRSEAAFVVETIQEMLNNGGSNATEIAVMYRTNAQSRLLEDAFMRSGLPYRLVGAQRFYGRKEIKDVIAYLRLVYNPSDEVSLNRIISVPPRKIGGKTLSSLQETAAHFRVSAGSVLIDLGNKGENSDYWESFSSREIGHLENFGRQLCGWQENSLQFPLPDLVDSILEDIRYREYLEDGSDEGLERWGNVDELRKLAYEYEENAMGLPEFLENLALVSDQDTVPEEIDAPTLLTLHAAKGLEFERVFIVGLDEGLLPHNRSVDDGDPEEMAEERRLFYVGITRAKRKLYLVRAERRTTYNSFQYSTPSRFLEDIPDELVESFGLQSSSSSRQYMSNWDQSSSYQRWTSNSAPASAAILEPKYSAGMRVNHPSWGEGVIMESRVEDGDELVDVHFSSVGFKRLLASLANLEILTVK